MVGPFSDITGRTSVTRNFTDGCLLGNFSHANDDYFGVYRARINPDTIYVLQISWAQVC